MKKRRKKLHRSNEGYTLVELIVTMLISSIVTLAVSGFLIMGIQYYNRTNAETTLQTESQVAELFLTELLQESEDYRVIDDGSGSTGVDYALEVKRGGKTYVTINNGGALWFAEVTGASDAEKVAEVINKGQEEAFLAKHVENFYVSPPERQVAISDYNGLVNLGLGLSVNGKVYVGDATVALRNDVRN